MLKQFEILKEKHTKADDENMLFCGHPVGGGRLRWPVKQTIAIMVSLIFQVQGPQVLKRSLSSSKGSQ